jgi:hypothetical protein
MTNQRHSTALATPVAASAFGWVIPIGAARGGVRPAGMHRPLRKHFL